MRLRELVQFIKVASVVAWGILLAQAFSHLNRLVVMAMAEQFLQMMKI